MGSLRVTVKNEQGVPVKGADVFVVWRGWLAAIIPIESTLGEAKLTTNASGFVTFTDIPLGTLKGNVYAQKGLTITDQVSPFAHPLKDTTADLILRIDSDDALGNIAGKITTTVAENVLSVVMWIIIIGSVVLLIWWLWKKGGAGKVKDAFSGVVSRVKGFVPVGF